MTIQQVQAARDALALQISNLIQAFEKNTEPLCIRCRSFAGIPFSVRSTPKCACRFRRSRNSTNSRPGLQ